MSNNIMLAHSIRTALMGVQLPEPVVPEAIDFDGVDDYLSRTSDFSGNSDSKTFTFSFFAYASELPLSKYIYSNDGNRFYCSMGVTGTITIVGANAAGTGILSLTTAAGSFPLNTYLNVICSIDLANAANRHVYVNDVDITSGVTWTTYSNDSIDFTRSIHAVSANYVYGSKWTGRQAHLFLDYTYRDLTNSANRRLFIDADGKPADVDTLIALSPIAYFQMTDPATAHINSGTGGGMVQNGDLYLSGRGPNQDNCVASEFDGAADYLSSASAIGSSSKDFTVSVNLSSNASGKPILSIAKITSSYSIFAFTVGTEFRLSGKNAAGTIILAAAYDVGGYGRNVAITVSGQMNDIGTFKLFADGVDASVTPSTYTDDFLAAGVARAADTRVGGVGIDYFDGSIGEAWFDDAHTDLATSNPFWDSDLGKPVPVRKVIADTAVTPLVAMPIEAGNEGLNLGTAGDYSITSGPFPGARGASEHWARTQWNGRTTGVGFTNYLSNAGLTDAPASTTTATIIMAIRTRDATVDANTVIQNIGGALNFGISANTSESVIVHANGAARATSAAAQIKTTDFTLIAATFDGTDVVLHSKVRGAATNRVTAAYSTAFDMSGVATIGSASGKFDFAGDIGFVYVTDSFVDMDDPDVWNIFFDDLDYPRDLTEAIAGADIPAPLSYTKYEDPDALETNSGSGGDYSITGTISNGADVGEV